jgi:hypothetical protein
MPAIDWIAINTQLNQVPPDPPDTPRVFAMVAPAVPAGVTDKVNLYSTLDEMEEDGWDDGDVAYNAMAVLLEQEPTTVSVSQIVVIKRETPVANVWTVDIISTTDGNHTVSIDGTLAATFAASGSTTTQIKDGLVSAFNLGAFASTHTAASVDADTLSITADVPGIPFTPTAAAPGGTAPTVTQTVANVGIFDDLEEAYPLSPFWGVLTPGALDVENDEARRWVQGDIVSRRNFLFAESTDTGIYDSGDTDNLAVDWLAEEYTRVNLLSHPTATDYRQSAMVGRLGGAFPGSRAWHYLATTGSDETTVTANRTLTQTSTLRTRRVSYTERLYGPASDLLTLGGYTPSGHYIVQRHAEDWWWYTIRATIDSVMKGSAGVNLNAEGLQGVVDAVKQAMTPLVTNSVIADDYTVAFEPSDLTEVPNGELSIGDFKTTGRILASATITPKLRALRVEAEFDLV